MQNNKPLLSLVILCFREGEYIPVYVRAVKHALKKEHIPHELILVANNFRNSIHDDSSRVAREVANNYSSVIVVTEEKNAGQKMGWDVRRGFVRARGDIIGFTDGDGQIEAEDAVRAYKLITEEKFDAVFGQRRVRKDGAARAFTSSVYNFLLRIFFPRVKLKDVNGKPKLFSAKAFHKMNLSSNNWFADSEMVIQSTYRNFRIGTFPTVFHENTRRPSTTSLWSVIESMRDIILYRFKLSFKKKHIL